MAFIDDGHRILELFGIPSEQCIEATMRFRAGSVPTIEATFYADRPDEEQLVSEVKRFILLSRDEQA